MRTGPLPAAVTISLLVRAARRRQRMETLALKAAQGNECLRLTSSGPTLTDAAGPCPLFEGLGLRDDKRPITFCWSTMAGGRPLRAVLAPRPDLDVLEKLDNGLN